MMGLFSFGRRKDIKEESASIRSSSDNIKTVHFSAKDIVEMRPRKKICRMDNIDFYIQFSEFSAKENRRWIAVHVVELQNEGIGTITIGWNSTDTSPSYTVNYISNTDRPGALDKGGIYTLKLNSPSFSFPDTKIAYGYVEKTTEEYATFTNIADNKSYKVSATTLCDSLSEDRSLLRGSASFVKVSLPENKTMSAYILNYYPTETIDILQYSYGNDVEALCENLGTCEQYNIPLRYIPEDVAEFDLLTGIYAESEDFKAIEPSGRIYALHKLEEMENDELNTGETVTTYGGFDTGKKVHIIRFEQSGNVTTQEIKESNVRKMDTGIGVGTRIHLNLEWDDAACQLLTDIYKE